MNTENDKHIAEFMDLVFYDDKNQYYDSKMGLFVGLDLLYSKSWDWLMLVVEKIESLVFNDDNYYNVTMGASCYCIIQDSNGESPEFIGDGETKLLSVYNAVVEFVKWYNQQNK